MVSSTLGVFIEYDKYVMRNSTYRLMRLNSTKFSPKIYVNGWKGGSVGNIKTYNLGNAVGKVGQGVGLANMAKTGFDVFAGETSLEQGFFDLGFGSIGVFGGWRGALISLSYDLGKVAGPSKWYGNDNTKWFE